MGTLYQYRTKSSEYDGEWKWQSAGMGYVIVTENKHLIVIDGGKGEDAEGFLKLIRDVSGSEKPTVDLWLITHPHIDHYGCLYELSENYADRFTILKAVWNLPDTFSWMLRGSIACADNDIQKIKSIPDKLDCEYYRPKKYDILNVDGYEIRILFTYECAEKISDPNELSIVFTVKGEHNKAMFTGDSYPMGLDCIRRDEKITEDMKKCDIIQVAHHGLNGGNTMFYKEVGAKIALVPISVSGNRAMNIPEENCAHNNLYAERMAETVIKAFTGTAGIDF